MAELDPNRAQRYLAYLTDAIKVSATQPPQFGTGKPVSLDQFRELYGSDPFYSWLGLDSEYLYTAHHAGAAMTSLYRKLGDGCQKLFRAIIRDEFGVDDEAAKWSYVIPKPGGKTTTRELDGYIDILEFPESEALGRFKIWLGDAKAKLEAKLNPRGAVFEVRQGYKSQDAKRSTGDVDNAGRIALQSCLPVLAVFSRQLPTSIARRYQTNGWLILSGDVTNDALSSTYGFSKEVMGFDLAGFLAGHVDELRAQTQRVFEGLLGEAPDGH